ncbi:MAG: DNA adenine methylase [Bacteroidetes bacterium]|nr:DNA adenine methylase [Bacteroidota bacterium]
MGSKKYLLANSLGKLIIEKAKISKRFFDLFSGSSSVVWFAAKKINNKIIASDLQEYSVVLARAVLLRTKEYDTNYLKDHWINSSRKEFVNLVRNGKNLKKSCKIIQDAYAGYYFSPHQALIFDILLKNMPARESAKSIAKAALVIAASQCVASPGHTAQPFSPTTRGSRYILEAWHRDPFQYAEKALNSIALQYSKRKGEAILEDANTLVHKVKKGDLVFIDTPYSGVHYSRFYHVLETIANGKKVKVSGAGRYPPKKERPSSKYSMQSTSKNAIKELIETLAKKKANVIITFPKGKASNGLSGRYIKSIAKKYFNLEQEVIKNDFSTLGGNTSIRPARKKSNEMILYLEPK